MSKKNKQSKKQLPEKKSYVSPTDRLWGRIVVWILVVAMVGGIIIGSIYGIIKYFK